MAGIRYSIEMLENREPLRSCWPRINQWTGDPFSQSWLVFFSELIKKSRCGWAEAL